MKKILMVLVLGLVGLVNAFCCSSNLDEIDGFNIILKELGFPS